MSGVFYVPNILTILTYLVIDVSQVSVAVTLVICVVSGELCSRISVCVLLCFALKLHNCGNMTELVLWQQNVVSGEEVVEMKLR